MKAPLTLFRIFLLGIFTFSIAFFFQFYLSPLSDRYDGQNNDEAYCATDHAHDEWLDDHPDLEQLQQQLELQYKQQLQQPEPTENAVIADYTIPVVVHIIHDNGPENISDAVVLQGIQDLNDAFANMGYYDQGTGVDTKLEFCLAQRDPDGNPTTGITRDVSALTEMTLESDDITVKDINRWNPTQYVNIWLVREICSFSSGCGVAGYAYFPASHGTSVDGIMMEAKWFGSNQANSGVQVHEMGHYLGLYHTFQGGCINNDCLVDGDRVCDTPPDQTTIAVPCDSDVNSCSTDAQSGFSTDQNDMFINYMDYGDWNCYSAFTQGQSDRMEFFLTGVRASLLNSSGCLDPCPAPITAAFTPGDSTVELDENVAFTNQSINANAYEWWLNGMQVSTSTDLNYQFGQLGTFELLLVATSTDPVCLNDSLTVTIEVICPVQAEIDYDQSGNIVELESNAANADQLTWTATYNNTTEVISNDAIFTYQMTGLGFYEFCLIAESGNFPCGDTTCIIVLNDGSSGDCEGTFAIAYGEEDTDENIYCFLPVGDEILVGGTKGEDALLMAINSSGELLWQEVFKPVDHINAIYDLKIDSDGFLFGAGSGLQPGVTDSRRGFAFRYNLDTHTLEWVQAPTHPTKASLMYDIQEVVSAGTYLFTGQTAPNSAPGLGCDGIILELDKATGAFGGINQHYTLGSCESFISSLMHDNALYITGRYNNAGGGTSRMRGAVTEFDLNGVEQWTRLYLVDANNANARLYSQDIIFDNGLVVPHSGDKDGTGTVTQELFVTKSDLSGELIWAKEYDFGPNTDMDVTNIISLPDGYLFLAFDNIGVGAFLVKIDKDGELIWAKRYGGMQSLERGREALIAYDDFLYIGCKTGGINNSDDILILKTDLEGAFLDSCFKVESWNVAVSDVPNAYDGLHDLTDYDGDLSSELVSVSVQATDLDQEVICSPFCVEICDNGLDDDGDGLIDCADPDCPECDCEPVFVNYFDIDGEQTRANVVISAGNNELYLAGGVGAESWIGKINAAGEFLWVERFDATAFDPEIITTLLIDSDSMLVAGGRGGSDQGFILKINPSDQSLLFAQSNTMVTRIRGILEPVPGGDYVMTGYQNFAPAPGGDQVNFLLSLDRNTGMFNGTLSQSYYLGSSSDDIRSATFYNDHFYTTGRYTAGNGVTNDMRAAISKFNNDGTVEWSRLAHVAPSESARLYGMDIMVEEDTLLVAYFGDENGTNLDISRSFVWKSDLEGNTVWIKRISSTAYENIVIHEVLPITDGYLFAGAGRSSGGTNDSDMLIWKMNRQGELIWGKKFGDTNEELSLAITNSSLAVQNDYFYYVGEDQTTGQAIMVKIDSEGNISGDCAQISDITVVTEVSDVAPVITEVNLGNYNSPIGQQDLALNFTSVTPNTDQDCFTPCPDEDCENGIDDDGDGLVDFYDPDCPCFDENICGTPFYNQCIPDCDFESSAEPFEMEVVWNNSTALPGSTPMVGDVDGDCIPDIVVIQNGFTGIRVIDSETGANKYDFFLNMNNSRYSHLALGDVDNDGMAEIFLTSSTSSNPRIFRFDYDVGTNDLVQTWESSTQIASNSVVPAENFSPALADFNYDGKPEVYIGNQIFDSETGLELVNGGSNNQGTFQLGNSNFMTSGTVAADVLVDFDCFECSGLELVAGNQVYAVQINSYTDPAENTMVVERMLPGEFDGFSRVVDFDRDGDLDAVVVTMETGFSGDRIYVWDLQTETQLGTTFFDTPNAASERIGPPSIGDVDGDGWPEIIVVTSFNITILEDYQEGGATTWGANAVSLIKSTLSTSDQSGATGTTIFDLNGDGKVEIIYRDETLIRVFDEDLVLLSSFSCGSGTATEYPVIADANADGETEFICNCEFSGLNLFQSLNQPWIKARRIWNQFNYNVVNVLDDGAIPAQQQWGHIVGDSVILNNFLQQAPVLDENGMVSFAAADLDLTADLLTCTADSLLVLLDVCNEGDSPVPVGNPVSFYLGNPTNTNATLWYQDELPVGLAVDSCVSVEITIQAQFDQAIYVIVNDDNSLSPPFDLPIDFPVTGIGECDYLNNMDSIFAVGSSIDLDLGPDTTICDNGSVFLNAGSGFLGYEWQDGSADSTYTAFEPGIYWVEVTDSCGTQSDTITIALDTATVLDIGPDIVGVCNNDSITFTLSGFDSYEWIPSDFLSCDTCAVVTANPPDSATYIVIGTLDNGCFSSDTVTILRGQSSYQILDAIICEGDSVIIGDSVYTTSTMTIDTLTSQLGCDSIIELSLSVLPNADTLIMDTIQLGETYDFNGQLLDECGIFTDTLEAANSCDSVITLDLLVLPLFETFDTLQLCTGDTLFVGDTVFTSGGQYEVVLPASNACDSVVTYTVEEFPTYFEVFDEMACEGEFFTFNGTPIAAGDSMDFNFMTGNGCDSTIRVRVEQLDTALLVQSFTICEGDTIVIFGDPQTQAGQYTEVLTGPNGCDSTVVINLSVLDEVEAGVTVQNSCREEATGSIELGPIVGMPPFTFDWSEPGISGPLAENLLPGNYEVTITDANQCQNVLSISVGTSPVSEAVVTSEPVTCFGFEDGMILVEEIEGFTYSLDGVDFSEVAVFDNLTEGTYDVFIQDTFGCVFIEEVTIFEPFDWEVGLPPDTTIDLGRSVELEGTTNAAGELLLFWDPEETLSCTDCIDPVASPLTTTEYTLTIEDPAGCRDSASIRVTVVSTCDDDKLGLPNIFTPDRDGVNDEFGIMNPEGPFEISRFQIFDRWGELVFQTNDKTQRWDGTMNGKDMPSDVYVYVVEFTCLNGEEGIAYGDVTLVR